MARQAVVIITGLVLATVFAFVGGWFLGTAGMLAERLRMWRLLSDSIAVVSHVAPYSNDGRLPIPLMLDGLYYARECIPLTPRQLRYEQLSFDFVD